MASKYPDKDLLEDGSAKVAENKPRGTLVKNANQPDDFDLPLSDPVKKEIDEIALLLSLRILLPIGLVRKVQWQTFSNWPQKTPLWKDHMTRAGFFYSGVKDRVICIYCNLICEGWTLHADDPCEVHKSHSPKCVYCASHLSNYLRPITLNDRQSKGSETITCYPRYPSIHQPGTSDIALVPPSDSSYREIPKRTETFHGKWPSENLPSVKDLVNAGFFYTGPDTIVTCFYCNGSLQNWGPNDNPKIEHARWFPGCPYAMQLCGDELHRQIQESERAQQERARANEQIEEASSDRTTATSLTADSQQSFELDKNTWPQRLTELLNLPISKYLLDLGFQPPVIKECWEDQLRRNHHRRHLDVFIGCFLSHNLIQNMGENGENIVILNKQMRESRERGSQICAYTA